MLPLILVTNDDGIESPGLWAAVAALTPLGEVLAVAPERQWSGAGRSMPPQMSGRLTRLEREIHGVTVVGYGVDATPALAVAHAMLELAPRRPALVVSGINFGENLSEEITISGTVGAALEGAAYGLPALAVSLEMPVEHHFTGGEHTDYTAAAAFTQRFARLLLERSLPYDVDVLNLNVPATATPETPWQLTRVSRCRYFYSVTPDRTNGQGRPAYRRMEEFSQVERDSDIWALRVARVVSVSPLSLDLTARADWGALEERMRGC